MFAPVVAYSCTAMEAAALLAFTVWGSSHFFLAEGVSHIFMHRAAASVHIISDK